MIRFHALNLPSSRCSCQVQSFEKIIPRCLWELTSAIWVWSNRTGGWFGLLCFPERRIDSDFLGLKITSHSSAQRWILAKFKFHCSAAWMGPSIIIYKLLSSAKSLIEELMLMSLIIKETVEVQEQNLDELQPLLKSRKNLHQAKQLFVSCHLDNQRTKSATIQIHLQI